jgi:hypothetical protein
VANNPCTICPDGATAGEDLVPYLNGNPYLDDNRTCKDIIKADLTYDAESEMCLVHAKEDEFNCCPSSTTAINDYCNICPNGITAGDDFVPWSCGHDFDFEPLSSGSSCTELVQKAKLYENGSVGCNYYKGYELRCCQGAGTADAENTPITPPSTPIPDISPPIGKSDTPTTTPSYISIILSTPIPDISPPIGKPETLSSAPTPSPTPVDPLYIVEVISAVVGAVAALVGAFTFAKWKQRTNSPTSTPAMPTTVP